MGVSFCRGPPKMVIFLLVDLSIQHKRGSTKIGQLHLNGWNTPKLVGHRS